MNPGVLNIKSIIVLYEHIHTQRYSMVCNKTLSRARDPCVNGAWLSKLTERNMKCLSLEDRELIRRARRDGREARGNEEREKRED